MLTVQTIKPARYAKHKVKCIGRGNASGHGTSATRGGKGQTARSGGSKGLAILGFRRLMQSTPKLRGFKTLTPHPTAVRIQQLDKVFSDGTIVTLAILKEKNLVPRAAEAAKIIGGGTLSKKLILEGIKISAGAKATLEAAGGSVK